MSEFHFFLLRVFYIFFPFIYTLNSPPNSNRLSQLKTNFFVNKRKNKNYIPDDPTEIQHVDEVLKLLQVMTGDARYKRIFGKKKEGVHSMCDVAERLEKIGWEKGQMEGQIEGKILVYKNLRREGFDEKEARRLTELPEDMTLEQ